MYLICDQHHQTVNFLFFFAEYSPCHQATQRRRTTDWSSSSFPSTISIFLSFVLAELMMVSESNIIKIIGLHDDNDDYNTSFAISVFPPKVVIDVSTLSTAVWFLIIKFMHINSRFTEVIRNWKAKLDCNFFKWLAGK